MRMTVAMTRAYEGHDGRTLVVGRCADGRYYGRVYERGEPMPVRGDRVEADLQNDMTWHDMRAGMQANVSALEAGE